MKTNPKPIRVFRVFLLSMLSLWCLAPQAATLTVTVSNIRSDVGTLNFSVYDGREHWLSENVRAKKALVVAEHKSDNGVIQAVFDLEAGEYAVSVHHDDNSNGEMDSNFIGIPKEPIGLSNGHVPRFGPPKYRKASFQLDAEGLDMPIKLSD